MCDYSGFSWQQIDDANGLQWGGESLYRDGIFSTRTAAASFIPSLASPLLSSLMQSITSSLTPDAQWNSGTPVPSHGNYENLPQIGSPPTLFAAFLYFDFSFAVWLLNGAMGHSSPNSFISPRRR
jgi:hypothetical protein